VELVELEFPGHAWPWVMNSEVLLISKPVAGESRRVGICGCFRFLLLNVSEEFNSSFVAEISSLCKNVSKQVLFCHDMRYSPST